jgi:hypothetical protein
LVSVVGLAVCVVTGTTCVTGGTTGLVVGAIVGLVVELIGFAEAGFAEMPILLPVVTLPFLQETE